MDLFVRRYRGWFQLCAGLALGLWGFDCTPKRPQTECSVTRPCANGAACVVGRCQCAAGQANCGGKCTTTASDALNCGACGTACPAGQSCVNSQCAAGPACPAGQLSCGGTCTNTQQNPDHCGACNTTCAVGQQCLGGVCLDPPPQEPGSEPSLPQEQGGSEPSAEPPSPGDGGQGPEPPAGRDAPTGRDSPGKPDRTPPADRRTPPSASAWAKQSTGSSQERAFSVAVDGSGNAYVAGHFGGTASFGAHSVTSKGGLDIFVAKIDGSGTWQWARRAGGRADDAAYSVTVDGSGNAYLTGSFRLSGDFGKFALNAQGGKDIFVAKISPAGAWLGARHAGSSGDDEGYGIAVDNSGNLFVTGYFRGRAAFGTQSLNAKGGQETFVATLDANGTWKWATRAGSPGIDTGTAIALGAGFLYVAGYFTGNADFGSNTLKSNGSYDVFVAKLSTSGAWMWAKNAGASSNEQAYGIAVDNSGNAYVTGFFTLKADFGSIGLKSQGNKDVFVAKISSSGAWVWAKPAGSNGAEAGNGIAVDPQGNLVVTGSIAGSAAFGTSTIKSTGGGDAFVAKLSPSGTWMWAKRAGSRASEEGYGVSTDGQGNIFAVGFFLASADFDATNLTAGAADVYVWKLGP